MPLEKLHIWEIVNWATSEWSCPIDLLVYSLVVSEWSRRIDLLVLGLVVSEWSRRIDLLVIGLVVSEWSRRIDLLVIGLVVSEWSRRILNDEGMKVDYLLANSTPQGRWTIKLQVENQVRRLTKYFYNLFES